MGTASSTQKAQETQLALQTGLNNFKDAGAHRNYLAPFVGRNQCGALVDEDQDVEGFQMFQGPLPIINMVVNAAVISYFCSLFADRLKHGENEHIVELVNTWGLVAWLVPLGLLGFGGSRCNNSIAHALGLCIVLWLMLAIRINREDGVNNEDILRIFSPTGSSSQTSSETPAEEEEEEE